jgi:hypothetical protein
VAQEEWRSTSKRILDAPFEAWRVLDSFEDWFKAQMQRKNRAVRVGHTRLDLTDGEIPGKPRSELEQRVREDNLVPRNFWQSFAAFDVIPAVETGDKTTLLQASTWWDFSDNELRITVRGPDRDEVNGFGTRVQAWLDSVTPDSTARPPRASEVTSLSGATASTTIHIRGNAVVGNNNVTAGDHSSVQSQSSGTNSNSEQLITTHVPAREPWSKRTWGFIFTIIGAVIAGGILKALGWV